MRRTPILLWSLVAVLLLAGSAHAAPGDPYVVYTANTYVDGAVILRTDPADGSLVEISRNGSQGSLFKRPYDLALEQDGDLLVADAGELCNNTAPKPCVHDGRIIRVDTLTGRQSTVSSGGGLVDPVGLVVGPNGHIWVVDNMDVDNDGAVFEVDPASGAQRLVTRGGDLDLPFGIAMDHDGSLVVVSRVFPNALTSCVLGGRITRVTQAGAQQRISPTSDPGDLLDDLLSLPLGVAIAADGSIMTTNECPGNGVLSVNPLNGDQTPLTSNSGSDVLSTPERIAFDPAGNLLVSDFSLGDGDGGIVAVDRSTGAQTLLRSGALFNHPLGIAAVVNHPPTAELSLSPARVAAGRAVRLDGSGSGDPDGQRLVYEWDLDGDGVFEANSSTSPVVNQTFSRDGARTVRLRVDDPHGGTAVASATLTVDGRHPVISRLHAGARVLALRRRRGGHGPPTSTLLRFRMSEAGTISVDVRRGLDGRRKGKGACRPRAKRGRRCVMWSRTRIVRHGVKAGANSIRLRARGLRPGRYRLLLTAFDRVGNASVPRSLPLRIVRR
jgi:DNA-binding beta-propeller fold protein YncE